MALAGPRTAPDVRNWSRGRQVAVCAITELGFIRVSLSPAHGATMQQARELLADWKQAIKPSFLPCDLSALDGLVPPTAAKSTDVYLANLAAAHGQRWVTLDERTEHPAKELVPRAAASQGEKG